MYTVDGFITLKISRKDLELIVNSLNVIIPIIKDKNENFGLYKTLLLELKNVEKQWEKKEEKYYSSKKAKSR